MSNKQLAFKQKPGRYNLFCCSLFVFVTLNQWFSLFYRWRQTKQNKTNHNWAHLGQFHRFYQPKISTYDPKVNLKFGETLS